MIAYHTAGAGTMPLIFLHGWRSSSAVWNNFMPLFSLEHYTTYALDLPGFGASETPRTPYALKDYADIVKVFIEKKKLNNVILISHSFGARVALKVTALYPNIISKIVLIGSGGARMHAIQRGTFIVIAKIVKFLFTPSFMRHIRAKIYQKMDAEDYIAALELKETFKNIINEDLMRLFHEITVPTLIIWGKNDKEAPLSYARIMHTMIPQSQLVILPNAGHFCFVDDPRACAETINAFLSE